MMGGWILVPTLLTMYGVTLDPHQAGVTFIVYPEPSVATID
jgi:uncharacterized membrane protein YfcA